MNEEVKNIGIIGLGFIGKIQAQVLTKNPLLNKFKLSAICDENIQHFPFSSHKNYVELLADKSIDAVTIATPPSSHFEIALTALQAGKHVMLEKPPTLTLDELQQLSAVAEKHEVTLFTAFHAAARPEVVATKEVLAGKVIKAIRVRYAEFALNYHNPKGWIFNPHIAGGGVLIDSGINAISIITAVLPGIEFNEVSSTLDYHDGFEVETAAHVDFKFNGDGHGSIDADWLHHESEERTIEIETDDGAYTIDVVHSKLIKDGQIIFNAANHSHGLADQHIEYRSLFLEFHRLISVKDSYVSERELGFVLEAYASSKQST